MLVVSSTPSQSPFLLLKALTVFPAGFPRRFVYFSIKIRRQPLEFWQWIVSRDSIWPMIVHLTLTPPVSFAFLSYPF